MNDSNSNSNSDSNSNSNSNNNDNNDNNSKAHNNNNGTVMIMMIMITIMIILFMMMINTDSVIQPPPSSAHRVPPRYGCSPRQHRGCGGLYIYIYIYTHVNGLTYVYIYIYIYIYIYTERYWPRKLSLLKFVDSQFPGNSPRTRIQPRKDNIMLESDPLFRLSIRSPLTWPWE